MGQNKAELLYKGKTFTDYSIEKAEKLGINQIYLSGNQKVTEAVQIIQDIYQEKVAEYLGISDFAELKDDFSVAKGDAILYAELKEDLIRVSLPNLCREVHLPIIIYSEKESKVEK